MQIDWFTVVAQTINFLILIVLLKLFLYKPIVRAMDEREAKIAARLHEAEEKRAQAEASREAYQQEREAFQAKKSEYLAQAKEEAENYRKKLFHETREAVELAQQRWEEAIEREREQFFLELRQQIARQSAEIARRALKDLSDITLERRMLEVFIHRLRGLDRERKRTIAHAIRRGDESVLIRSAFELQPQDRRDLLQAINEYVLDGHGDLQAHYENSPEVISGIEIQVHGHRIAWTLEDYLDSLEERVTIALEEKTRDDVVHRETP